MSRKLVVHISRTVYGVSHGDVGVMGGSYTVPCRAQGSPWPLPGLKSPRRELHAWGPARTGAEATHTSYIVLPTSEFWPQNPHFRKSNMVVYAVVPTLRMQRQLKPWHSLNGQLNWISKPQANEVTAPDQGEGDNSWGMAPQVVLWPPHLHTCSHVSHVHIGTMACTEREVDFSQMPVFPGVGFVVEHFHFTC